MHIGVGGFHRAHQAVHLDELARRGSTEWGVIEAFHEAGVAAVVESWADAERLLP